MGCRQARRLQPRPGRGRACRRPPAFGRRPAQRRPRAARTAASTRAAPQPGRRPGPLVDDGHPEAQRHQRPHQRTADVPGADHHHPMRRAGHRFEPPLAAARPALGTHRPSSRLAPGQRGIHGRQRRGGPLVQRDQRHHLFAPARRPGRLGRVPAVGLRDAQRLGGSFPQHGYRAGDRVRLGPAAADGAGQPAVPADGHHEPAAPRRTTGMRHHDRQHRWALAAPAKPATRATAQASRAPCSRPKIRSAVRGAVKSSAACGA